MRCNCLWIETTDVAHTSPVGPLRKNLTADVAIIGGGYTGLATALYLSELLPERKIVLLEAARIGCGASGRNDGLVLPFTNGSEAIIDRLIEDGAVEEGREIFRKTSAGIDLIQRLVEKHGIDCDWESATCLIGARTQSQVARLEKLYRRCRAIGLESQWLTSMEQQRLVNVDGYAAACTIPVGGMVNPAKLARGLLPVIRARGVDVYEGSPVVEFVKDRKLTIRTPGGSLSADAAVLATNAYTSKLGFFRNRIIPVHSFNIATEPLSEKQVNDLNWRARSPMYDVRNFFELFRLTADNRIAFSGGDAYYYYRDGICNDEDHRDYERLRRCFARAFPMLEGIEITHRWVGLVGLTLDRIPAVGVAGPSDNIYYALGYSGHGVPVSFLAGKLISEWCAGQTPDPSFGFFVNRKVPVAPPEPLKSASFALYKRYLRWRDSR